MRSGFVGALLIPSLLLSSVTVRCDAGDEDVRDPVYMFTSKYGDFCGCDLPVEATTQDGWDSFSSCTSVTNRDKCSEPFLGYLNVTYRGLSASQEKGESAFWYQPYEYNRFMNLTSLEIIGKHIETATFSIDTELIKPQRVCYEDENPLSNKVIFQFKIGAVPGTSNTPIGMWLTPAHGYNIGIFIDVTNAIYTFTNKPLLGEGEKEDL